MFKDMKMSLGHDIYFREGLPMFELDLSDIDPKYNKIIELDDLMGLDVDNQIFLSILHSVMSDHDGRCGCGT